VNEDKLEKIEELSLLLDFYGELLSAKQREFLKLYHEENLSLGEIAEKAGVSRQSVFDGVKKAQNALYNYEEKLKLLSSYQKNEGVLFKVNEALCALLMQYGEDKNLYEQLLKIQNELSHLDI